MAFSYRKIDFRKYSENIILAFDLNINMLNFKACIYIRKRRKSAP